ncbi:MAG: hypothetical protein AAF525_04945 [Pseudomonadota bacterium]
MRLPQRDFDRAIDWLLAYARPLERAQTRMIFLHEPEGEVVTTLGAYQNPDGGFGHGLEADLRSPLSSVLCTHVALEVAAELTTATSLVESAVRYLAAVYDPEYQYWPFLDEAATADPHAPWWSGRSAEEDQFSINPMLLALSWVTRYQQFIPDFPLETVSAHALTCLVDHPQDFSKDAVACCLHYLEVASPQERDRIESLLLNQVPDRIERDASQWGGYCMRPLDIVSSPNSLLYDCAADVIPENIEYLFETQQDNGCWVPNWSWRGQFPEAWEDAHLEWSGVTTLRTLRQLQAFDALPEV